MTTLTFDLSELDEELGDLLAHRWTVRLSGERANEAQRVIAPPPSETTLTYSSDTEWTATGFVLLRDDVTIKCWPFRSVLRFTSIDTLLVTLRLTS